jgi:hypothetical protein
MYIDSANLTYSSARHGPQAGGEFIAVQIVQQVSSEKYIKCILTSISKWYELTSAVLTQIPEGICSMTFIFDFF